MAQLTKNSTCTLDASRALQRDKALRTEAAHCIDVWKLMETDWKAQDRPLVADTKTSALVLFTFYFVMTVLFFQLKRTIIYFWISKLINAVYTTYIAARCTPYRNH